MMPQREVPIASFDIGTGALEHVREFGRLGFELALLSEGQVAQRPAGLKEWSAQAFGPCTQRLSLGHCPGCSHALEVIRGNQMGMHSVGLGLCQVQLPHLLPDVTRDELDGGLHFGHHTLGFLNPLQACLAEAFLLSNDADRVDVLLDIPRNELAVATYTALQVDKVVGMAEATDTLGDQRALRSETLVLVLR